MTTIALTDCCTILGIDPKTLRHWLKHANMPFVAHPTDACLKCLTEQQVQQLAVLHGRPLQSFASAPPAIREGVPGDSLLAERQATSVQASETSEPSPLPLSFPQEADLMQKLSLLQSHLVSL